MIYCNVKGGLGNILFQIAGAIGIAKQTNDEFSFPNLINQLHYLNQDNFYNEHLKHALDYSFLFEGLNQTQYQHSIKLVKYPFEFINYNLPKNDYLIEGFFQSEKYFIHAKDEILKQFKEPEIINELLESKYPEFLARTTSIHVRRGDYLKNINYHPIQTISYFNQAMEILDSETDYFIVFSDDIDWCKNNLIGDKIVYLYDEVDYIDLFLMARCNNNIISNSSFSWWGAWLNKNENKKIIAPNLWFGPMVGENISDIIPENWIKL